MKVEGEAAKPLPAKITLACCNVTRPHAGDRGRLRADFHADRHDLRGLKAEDVADAHRRDVDIQERHGLKYLEYWFRRQ